ncbi:alpha-tocopherol transfer protein-like isoform X1 [Ixodes scapularis]|uniref:alpha-tocopherol transfer protein-like isoform X1 n=1 Tax=Ixodes scapularis TaxID=6945 RepID=UPI001C394A40|nr:alpha-tocopherol transfer protein-like isoform X1 [Ixodes scapularis]XP_042142476.1 alpha-tocopherol transfer protein-like isoform X1 [Ixodes scapularis]
MERISLDLETIAKRELGETPQVKEDAVAQLRALLSEDPVLHCPLDEDFLVKFLRSRKFHVRETLDVIRRYFRVRQEYTDLFDNLLPSRILYDATLHQNQLLTVPKQRDSLGRLIVIFKLGAWNPAVCSLNEFFRLVLVGTDCNLMDPTNQITGIVGVVDLDGLHISHFLYFTPSEIRRTVKIMQDSYPLRVKAVYFINNPPVFQLIYAFVRVLLKPKHRERTHVIGRDYEKLHKFVPREGLPTEYGGLLESYDYGELEATYRSKEDIFVDLSRYGYQERQELKESVGFEQTDCRSAVK